MLNVFDASGSDAEVRHPERSCSHVTPARRVLAGILVLLKLREVMGFIKLQKL